MKSAVFSLLPAVTKGLKKVTSLFQISLFPHKKVKFAHFSISCNVKKNCDVMYNNNAKIISQIPSSSNLLLKNRVFKLRGNQRFVYKSKMATKIRV